MRESVLLTSAVLTPSSRSLFTAVVEMKWRKSRIGPSVNCVDPFVQQFGRRVRSVSVTVDIYDQNGREEWSQTPQKKTPRNNFGSRRQKSEAEAKGTMHGKKRKDARLG